MILSRETVWHLKKKKTWTLEDLEEVLNLDFPISFVIAVVDHDYW